MSETSESASEAELVQCEVTGQWVAEGELITFQGRRVCAQGKAELLERLRCGQSLPGELERPSVLRRFASMFLDNILIGVVTIVVSLILTGGSFFAASVQGASAMGIGFALAQLVNLGISITYYTLMHGSRGQTVGKMAGRIKVVNADGTPITMQTAFLRIIYLYIATFIASLFLSAAALTQSDQLLMASNVINGIGGVYVLVGVVMAILDRDQQRTIHDRLAKTRVIQIG